MPIAIPTRTISRRVRAFATGLFAAVISIPAVADDTEVFQSHLAPSTPVTALPNVLFIFDTSSSMAEGGIVGAKPFDPGKALTFYDDPALNGPCRHDRIYWSSDGTIPNCSTNQYFDASQLRCRLANQQLNGSGVGVYQDRLARYDPTTDDWRELSLTVHTPAHVECKNDRGLHGESRSSLARNIASGKGAPWQIGAAGETNFDGVGRFYTLYSGKYMNYVENGARLDPGAPNRLEVLKAAANQIIAANTSNIRAGIMRFDTKTHCTIGVPFFGDFCFGTNLGNKGGPVIFPVRNITTRTDRQDFQNVINSLTALGSTPLSETLYEAYRYYAGLSPHFGSNPPTNNTIQSVSGSLNGAVYKTPIEESCQRNNIVLLTDGVPTRDIDADPLITNLLAAKAAAETAALGVPRHITDTQCSGNEPALDPDNCLDELATVLGTQDTVDGMSGNQLVNLYTIGFFTDQELLRQAASNAGGRFFEARSITELATAFQSILTDIHEQSSTFSAPAVSVNAFNRITNREELFFSLFEPSNRERWPGNIKRYRLGCVKEDPNNAGFCTDEDGDTFPDSPSILDVEGRSAIDPITGFFRPASRSFWTKAALGDDGPDTEKGGAASVFGGQQGLDDPPDPARKVFTYTGTYVESASDKGLFVPPTTDADLSLPRNLVDNGTPELLVTSDDLPATAPDGLLESFFYPFGRQTSDPTLTELVNWTKGIDVRDSDNDGSTTDARHQFGDALHSKPLLVTYGTTEADPKIVLYTTDNEGVLRGINIDDGSEVFTFIPQEMLPRVPNLLLDRNSSAGKSYGLDGPLTVWFDDKNGNGFLNAGGTDQETVYLFFGQRRGGRRYFAMDVTNRAKPRLLWKIEGGVPGTAFEELGQTWSSMIHAKVQINSTIKDVVVFAAGYDERQDLTGAPIDDTIGRGLYMVDARTGELLWHGRSDKPGAPADESFAGMDNSIPGDINIFDITGDGLADRMYLADTGGRIWRFDITNGESADKLVIGKPIADFQDTTGGAVEANNRRFYQRPDVSVAAPNASEPFLAITIGSGYRAHPLDKNIEDRFYVIRDPNVQNVASTSDYISVREADMADVTDVVGDVTSAATITEAQLRVGWFIKLTEPNQGFIGEKVLADSVVFNNVVLFTTFIPPDSLLTEDCLPNQGTGRVFAVSLFDGTPVNDLDPSVGGALNRRDRHIDLVRSGIPPNVVILFSKMNGVSPVGFVATEKIEVDFSDAPVKTYWFQQEVQ